MTVLELLDELEEIVNAAPKLPLTGKIMVDANEVLDLAKDIRLSLPDDVQQAKWVKDEKERILDDAKSEYEKIIMEAKKQADTMVEKDVITERAVDVSGEIYRRADEYSKSMRLRTYNYMDEMLASFRDKMDELNETYVGNMMNDISAHFAEITGKLNGDIAELRSMTEDTENAAMPEHTIDIPVNGAPSESDPEE